MTRILYVGPLWEGSTCLQRKRALEDLGHETVGVDTAPASVRDRLRKLSQRVRRRLLGPADLAGANARILAEAGRAPFDLLWLDKALAINASTLRAVRRLRPACRIVGFFPDDMTLRHNLSRTFRRALPLYDVAFIHRTHGVAGMRALGCRDVRVVRMSYHPKTHRPVPVTPEERAALGGPVGFIGMYEEGRARSLHHLAARGVPVRVWGPAWERCRLRHRNLRLERASLWGADYTRAVCSFDIVLGFLSRMHLDRHTTRSLEVPACGAFLLAERTDEHLEMFVEGKEAEFFASDEELARKVDFYLDAAHAAARRRIAAAGLMRCRASGYSCHHRLEEMLRQVAPEELAPA